MRPTPRSARLLSGLAVAGLLLAACGDDVAPVMSGAPDTAAAAETSDAPESTDAAVITAVPESTVDPAATATPDTTSPAPETTAAPAPESTAAPAVPSRGDLTLRSNGVGSADIGQADIEVIPYVTGLLGAPASDQLGEYPTFDDDLNMYTNVTEEGFVAPFGRTTCYDNQFCLYFGGATNEALRFVGWSQESFDVLSDPLQTAEGVTIGSRQSDHLGSMTVSEGGCFSSGNGDIAGVLLYVTSEGEPFGSFDDDGNFVLGNPLPEDIVVTGLEGGDRPFFLFADC